MSEPRPSDGVERVFGAALMAAGALVFSLCGLCTLGVAGSTLMSVARYPMHAGGALGSIALVGFVGGLPTLGGFLLMRFGWRMYSGQREPPPKDGAETFHD
jgi:hypothetical protein